LVVDGGIVLVSLYYESVTIVRHMGRVGPTYANLHHIICARSKHGKRLKGDMQRFFTKLMKK